MFDTKQAIYNDRAFKCDDCHFRLSSHVVLRKTLFGNAIFFGYKHYHPDETLCACMNIEIIPIHNGGL